jgi:hypothetical protein
MKLRLLAAVVLLAGPFHAETVTVTCTGWFSDSKCAASRAASGLFTATNPDCAKTSIQNGAAPAFIAEQQHAVFTVMDSPPIIDFLGYHVQVRAAVDNAARTIRILEVKQLSCLCPPAQERFWGGRRTSLSRMKSGIAVYRPQPPCFIHNRALTEIEVRVVTTLLPEPEFLCRAVILAV